MSQRDDPYSSVWSEPKQIVAKKIGISDVALGKACKKLRIPVPGRGYWPRIASGQQIAKPRLPTLKPGEPGTYPVFKWVEGTAEGASGTALEKAVHPNSCLSHAPERERSWGYWARTYKGW